MFLTEYDVSESYSMDLFDCLTEKEKARGRRKGIRMAKREDFLCRVLKFFKIGRLWDGNGNRIQ